MNEHESAAITIESQRTPGRRLTADDLAQTVGGVLLLGCCPQGCSGCIVDE
jgi:hypothetical protein